MNEALFDDRLLRFHLFVSPRGVSPKDLLQPLLYLRVRAVQVFIQRCSQDASQHGTQPINLQPGETKTSFTLSPAAKRQKQLIMFSPCLCMNAYAHLFISKIILKTFNSNNLTDINLKCGVVVVEPDPQHKFRALTALA